MAAVSAELASLRERQIQDLAASSAAAADGGDVAPRLGTPEESAQEIPHTVVRDDRWERWWPEAPEDDEPFRVVSPPTRALSPRGDPDAATPDGGPRHASHRGRSAPTSRMRLAPVHLTVLALLVAAAIGCTAWWVARSAPDEVTAAVPAMPLTSTSPSPLAAGSAAPVTDSNASPQSAVVVVHVAGKVVRPGVQELPLGARVADALRAAGGPRAGVSLTSLNLARRLQDGEQVVVGAAPGAAGASATDGGARPGTAASSAASNGAPVGAPVNLNTATESELDTLPGVGPVTAAAIVEHREKNGAFTSVDQLIDVSGIGEATLAKLAPLVSL